MRVTSAVGQFMYYFQIVGGCSCPVNVSLEFGPCQLNCIELTMVRRQP